MNADATHANDVGSDSSRSDSTTVSDAATTISDVAGDDGSEPCTPDFDVMITCPTDLPPDDDCPDAAPSYTNEVAAVIAARCTVCHRPGGAAASIQFDTYAKISANNNKIHMVTQVHQCRMPPPSCADPLSAQERQTLLQWLVCGGPNN